METLKEQIVNLKTWLKFFSAAYNGAASIIFAFHENGYFHQPVNDFDANGRMRRIQQSYVGYTQSQNDMETKNLCISLSVPSVTRFRNFVT